MDEEPKKGKKISRTRRVRRVPTFDLDVPGLRGELGLSQAEFAARLEVSLRTVMRWEAGKPPQEAARKKLVELYQRLHDGGTARNELRVGICFEFLDTSYPLLTQTPVNFVARS